MYGAGFTISGNPGTTKRITLTDGGQSLETLFGAGYRLPNKQEPTAFSITVESNHMRVGFGEASSSIGHLVRTYGSVRFASLGAVQKARLCNATAGSDSVVQITLEY